MIRISYLFRGHSRLLFSSLAGLILLTSGYVGTRSPAVVLAGPGANSSFSFAQTIVKVPASAPASNAGNPPPLPGHSRMLGMNLSVPVYWTGERNFMNLTMGAVLWNRVSKSTNAWSILPEDRITNEGVVRYLESDESATLMLTKPGYYPDGVQIRCSWQGDGELTVRGTVRNVRQDVKSFEFTYLSDPRTDTNTWLELSHTNPSDPVRNIDCREPSASPTALFSPDFLDLLRPFAVLRFMDWQNTNANLGGNWNRRTQPGSFFHGNREGVAIEHMIELAKQAGADPWFQIPFGADEEYITRFAQLVHDRLPPERKVYVELGNEVWNYAFPVSHVARDEGLAAGLSNDAHYALIFRYAQKASKAMRIWSRVFADRPSQLVRVYGAQSVWAEMSELGLSFRDTAKNFDALATAPYFGANQGEPEVDRVATIDEFMLLLGMRIDKTLQDAWKQQTVANRLGLRHITYEAGQHVVLNDAQRNRAIQRDPRMYDLYKRYIEKWMTEQNDLLVLFNSTHPIMWAGAWGMQEYSGQPLSETPKKKAIIEAATKY